MFALALALVTTPVADADYGSHRIKNIRIRERQNTNGYRAVVVVDDDGAADFDAVSATLSFSALDGGPALSDLTVETPRRARVSYRADGLDLGGVTDDGSLTVAMAIVNGSVEAGIGPIEVDTVLTVDGGWEELGFGETGKLALRLRADDDTGLGVLDARVFSEDRDWDPSEVAGVSAAFSTARESVAVDLSATASRAQLVATWADDALAASGFSYAVTTTLSGPDGVLDTRSEQLEIAAPDFDDGLVKARYRRKANGTYKVVTLTGSDEAQPLQGLLTTVTDAGGAVLLESFDESPVSVERDYVAAVAFDSDPAGQTFALTLTARDADGNAVGEPVSGELTLAAAVDTRADLVLNLPVFGKAADCCVISGSIQAEGDVGFEFSVTGDGIGEVASVELSFDEPFEGATPQENPVTLDFGVEWHKWVDTFESDTVGDGDVTVDQALFTEDGGLLDETRWTGFPGRTYHNGTGTRISIGTVRSRPSLL